MEGFKDMLAVLAGIALVLCILYMLGWMAMAAPIAATIR